MCPQLLGQQRWHAEGSLWVSALTESGWSSCLHVFAGGRWKSHLPCCCLAQKSRGSSSSTGSHHRWGLSQCPVSWCHVFALAPCATSWGACRQQVARPPAEMAFNYFLSRVALIKISMSNFLTRKVQAIGHSRGKLPVLLAGSALPRFPPAAAGEAPVPGRAMGSTARRLNFH